MASAWPEVPFVIPAEWPAERTAGASTKRNGTGVRSITTGRQSPLSASQIRSVREASPPTAPLLALLPPQQPNLSRH